MHKTNSNTYIIKKLASLESLILVLQQLLDLLDRPIICDMDSLDDAAGQRPHFYLHHGRLHHNYRKSRCGFNVFRSFIAQQACGTHETLCTAAGRLTDTRRIGNE